MNPRWGLGSIGLETIDDMEEYDMIVYPGSNVVVENPRILSNGFAKDFGYGFYCTAMETQAVKWALTKHGKRIVNVYEYNEVSDSLELLLFEWMTDEWLDFVVACRKGVKHGYDVVEGPMANDTIWNYVEDFVVGKISRSAFWELAKFKHPTHQIVYCTDKALTLLKFKGHKIL